MIYITYVLPSKCSWSDAFQLHISRITDQQIQNKALQAHYQPEVFPSKSTLPSLKLLWTDLIISFGPVFSSISPASWIAFVLKLLNVSRFATATSTNK